MHPREYAFPFFQQAQIFMCMGVLGLAGIVLIVFVPACMVLCFEFMTKMVFTVTGKMLLC